MNPLKARILLDECTGRDIWSLEHCQRRGVPQVWIDELQDCFESGFRSDRQTIYHKKRIVNQYQGIRDVDLAYKLAEYLGVDVQATIALAPTPEAEVRALKEAADE
jgi:hypothetical protein